MREGFVRRCSPGGADGSSLGNGSGDGGLAPCPSLRTLEELREGIVPNRIEQREVTLTTAA